MAGKLTERQENGFITLVNNLGGGKLISKAGGDNVDNVVEALKFTGRSAAGTEPYTDVVLTLKNKKTLNISMKGPTAPSLAGGGLAGMELVIPGIGRKFMEAALEHHKKTLKKGEKVPDLYAKLNKKDKLLLVIGNTKNGGPIDYMYIGPMDVKATKSGNKIQLNGKILDAEKYAKDKDLYFRLRARREDQTFDPDATDSKGIPTVYGRSPSRGDAKGRIVITDKVPSERDVITF